MKHLSIIALFIVLSCSEEHEPSESCIDPFKIDKDAICTLELAPVCGCNNVTYGNACAAKTSGVLSWQKGACK